MVKSKLYLIISIITLICFFGTAAICNQCAADTVEDAESTIEEDEIAAESTIEEDEIAAEEAVEEEDSKTLELEEEEAEEEESAEEEEEIEDVEKEVPTITLEVYDGPTYSSADDVCYYRIKAIVTGNPTPIVEFSKDDSGGAWGSKKVQINLHDPSETYNLTATTTNSEGTDTDNINLSWGCFIPNNPPEISGIVLPGGNIYILWWYDIEAVATDPDGDTLTFEWSVSEGTMDDPTSNPLKWTTPTTGTHEVTVVVDDGKGGTDTMTEVFNTVDVLSMTLNYLASESGEIEKNVGANLGVYPYYGDSEWDNPVRAYFSYNVSALAGTTVITAKLGPGEHLQNGDPYSLFQGLRLEVVDWGNDQLNLNDYYLQSTLLTPGNGITISCSIEELRTELQKAIDMGKPRFQVRIWHMGNPTNSNVMWDGVRYKKYPLQIQYIYVQ